MAARKLSQYQVSVIAHLRAHGRTLVRYPGGFWSTPDTLLPSGRTIGAVQDENPDGYMFSRHGPPDWYTQTGTVQALTKAGVLVRTSTFTEAWRDTRKLADNYNTGGIV